MGGDRVGDGDGLRGMGRGVDLTVGRNVCGRRLNNFAMEYRRRSGMALGNWCGGLRSLLPCIRTKCDARESKGETIYSLLQKTSVKNSKTIRFPTKTVTEFKTIILYCVYVPYACVYLGSVSVNFYLFCTV